MVSVHFWWRIERTPFSGLIVDRPIEGNGHGLIRGNGEVDVGIECPSAARTGESARASGEGKRAGALAGCRIQKTFIVEIQLVAVGRCDRHRSMTGIESLGIRLRSQIKDSGLSCFAHVRDRTSALEGRPLGGERIEDVISGGFNAAAKRQLLGSGRRSARPQDEQQTQTEETSWTMHELSPFRSSSRCAAPRLGAYHRFGLPAEPRRGSMTPASAREHSKL